MALCGSARTFVDVGAHIGLISLAVARACPELRVVAFECDRAVAARFLENAALNRALCSRVRLVEAAVGESEGLLPFAPSGNAANTGVGRLAEGPNGRGDYAVRVTSLASFCKEGNVRPDVVKIDVEGGELKVLRGMRGMPVKPRAIMLETHGFYYGPRVAEFNEAIIVELHTAGYPTIFSLQGRSWEELGSAAEMGARNHLLALRGS